MDIKCIRVQIGLTQKQFADFLGVTRSQVAKLELGMRKAPSFISLLLTRINLAIVQYQYASGVSSINNAIQKRIFKKHTYAEKDVEFREEVALQMATLLYVVSELRRQYTDERLTGYFDSFEADAKWKLSLIRNADEK